MPGRYFDEWRVGDRVTHQPSRTVTETDNLMFSAMTHNLQQRSDGNSCLAVPSGPGDRGVLA